MNFFKKSVLIFVVLFGFINTGFSNRIENNTSNIDINMALKKFSGVNQLGDLQLIIPNSHYFHTSHNVPVIFTPMNNVPIVDIKIDFKNSGSFNAKSLREDGDLIADMLATSFLQGTKDLDEEQFAEKMALIAGNLSVEAGSENFTFSIRSVNDESLNDVLSMFADVYQNPRFDDQILARNKARMIESAKESEESPEYLASRAFRGIMQANNPNAFDKPAEQINKVTRGELLKFKQQFLVASNAKIAITGDISLDRATSIAKQITSILPKGEEAKPIKPFMTPKPIHYHITHPSTQTFVLIGGVTPTVLPNKSDLQRYHDYTLGNSILAGGDFNARLMQAIRVKGGYTYGITGGLGYNSQRGIYQIDFSTKNEQASQAIADTLATINEVLKNGVNQAELDLEKTGAKNAYPTRFASHSGVHGAVSSVFFDNYPKDHLLTRFERLDNATLQSVNAALRHFILPDNFVVVTVGAKKPEVVLPKDRK